MSNYIKSLLKVTETGAENPEELLAHPDFIEYCKRFDGPIEENFREKFESFIVYKMKQSRKKE